MRALRPYAALEAEFLSQCRRLSVRPSHIGTLHDYTLWSVQLSPARTQSQSLLLVAAGLHGDEVGGVAGALAWLRSLKSLDDLPIAVTLLPCLNPYGYERGIRETADGLDPNRGFGRTGNVLTEAVTRIVATTYFDLVVDLHEDWEMSRFYLYELKPSPPFLGESIIEAVTQASDAISHGEVVDAFCSVTNRGIVRNQCLRTGGCHLPQSLLCRHLYSNFIPHAICSETPMSMPFAVRTQLQVRVIATAVAFLGEEGSEQDLHTSGVRATGS